MSQQSFNYIEKILDKIERGDTSNINPVFKYLEDINTYKGLICTAKTPDDFLSID